MDTNLRNLLTFAQDNCCDEGKAALMQVYDLIRTSSDSNATLDGPAPFSQDVYVITAEIAHQVYHLPDVTRDCLRMYFLGSPPTNQFLCRAYQCEFQLLAPSSAEKPEELEKALIYLLKAIKIAKENPKYHFLVYNSSVIYWQFSRPFLKPRYRQFLARSLHQVVKALDDIDDQDFEWRAQLMISLIECHMDAGRKNDASHIATAAASFIKQHVPSLYKTVFGLMVRHHLVEPAKYNKDLRSTPELNIYHKICLLKLSIEEKEEKDVPAEMRKILSLLSDREPEAHAPPTTTTPPSREKTTGRLSASSDESFNSERFETYEQLVTSDHVTELNSASALQMSRLHESSVDSEEHVSSDFHFIDDDSPEVEDNSPRELNSDKLSELMDSLFDEEEDEGKTRRGRTPSMSAASSTPSLKIASDSEENDEYPMNDIHLTQPFLLLELGRLALEQDLPEIGQQCANYVMECTAQVRDPTFFLEVEFLNCDLMVKLLKDKQETFRNNIVQIRQQAIKRCDEALKNAVRMANPNVIQAGCVTQWNLCLPMLQANLRQRVRRPLATVAEALQSIHSLLNQLRCQVHTELAKCEEEQEQIQVAMQHLQQAMLLDDGGMYRERLHVAFLKLKLRAELYQQPEAAEQQAGMIIEQARKADSGTTRMKRSLLVRAGETLAPEAFLLVLDSESDTKEVSGGKGALTKIIKLSNKAQQFQKCVQKAEGHLRRLGDENDRERARLWSDLAKTARKQEVWDVCRVASRFALLYDDGRWTNKAPAPQSAPAKSKDGSESTDPEKSKDRISSAIEVPLYDKDLIRTLAEVNFINGEALIHLLRSEGVELGDKPTPPVDKRKHPKGYVAKKPEEDPDWLVYCDWITALSEASVACFLRAMSLGIELGEAWIVCSSAAYIWNYNNHVFSQERHSDVVGAMQALLDGLTITGHAGETVLLVDICNNLASGLMQPWVPKTEAPGLRYKNGPAPDGTVKAPASAKGSGKGTAAVAAGKKPAGTTISISGDATRDLKRAVEVCEHAMKVTNGEVAADVIPIANRYPILQNWVKAKQMLSSNIPRSYGTDEEGSTDGQNAMTRALVAVEMLSLQSNRIFEFKDAPSLSQAVEMVEAADWTDRLVELQLWTKLTNQAFQASNHAVATHCAEKALSFASAGTQPKGRKVDQHKHTVEQEMLSHASSLYAQSLMENTKGKNSVRRQAMAQFISSARFASNAHNYDLVMSAARHYWNAGLALINQPIERELLRDSLQLLLQCISKTTDKRKYRKDDDDEDEEEDEPPSTSIAPVDTDEAAILESEMKEAEKHPTIVGGPEDDLTIRAYLYGLLFQSYADKGEWEAGLMVMDEAIADMPRTNHRLLIFKHLVVVRAKLGLSVNMSIQKFKDESEDYVAHMWRRVALCSRGLSNQLTAYQNAIEALNSPSSQWQKVDYLVEFSQWLFCNEFPLNDATQQLQWAIDIILNMKFQTEEAKAEAKTKKSKKKGKTPPASAKKSKKVEHSSQPKEVNQCKSPAQSESMATVVSESADTEMRASEETIIGVRNMHPSLCINDLNNIRQLEMLFRTHVLLAQMQGRSSPHYVDNHLLSVSYLMRIWQISLSHCGVVVKDLAKAQAEDVTPKSADKKGKGKDKEAPVKEKAKRRGPLDAMPRSVEEWATYDTPDEVIEAFKQEAMNTTGINKTSFDKPMFSMYYLDVLVDQLRTLGHSHLALPVLALQDVICRGLLQHRAATALVHLKAQQVCTELNISAGISFHSALAEGRLMEEEQAKGREEIELWNERQAQVAKEEMRLKESLVTFKESSGRKVVSRQSNGGKIGEAERDDEMTVHLGRTITGVELRTIWADTAEIFIENSLYKHARELLKESLLAAEAFSDAPLHGRVLHLLAKLSFKEAQFSQAISLCRQAQKTYDGDEMFWYHSTMLMVEASLSQYELKLSDRSRKARAILINALNIFKENSVLHSNRASTCTFILCKLEAKVASVQAAIAFEEHDGIFKPNVMKAIDSACKKLEHCASEFAESGFHRDAVQILEQHADILACLAKASSDRRIKHEYFVKALRMLKDAASTAEQVFQEVLSTNHIHEMKGISTPVQRELASVKMSLVELMLQMYTVFVDELRNEQMQNVRKGSVLRAVEDLIREEPNHTELESAWIASTAMMGEAVLNEISCAHSLLEGMPHLRAKSLLFMGQGLRLQAVKHSPDAPGQWVADQMEALQVELHAQTATASPEPEENAIDSNQQSKYSSHLSVMQKQLTISHEFLVQATECLTQAVQIGLAQNTLDIVADASLELVECFGQFEPALAAQYLALHQSCQASVYMQDLMQRSLCDPLVSQRAALLHQRRELLSSSVSSNAIHTATMKKITSTLENTVAWKRLAVSAQHLDISKEFPPNFNLIVLQHSPDRSKLYGAVLDKSKGGQPAKGKGQTLPGSSKAKVIRIDSSAEQLDELLSKWKWWRYDVMQVLLKQEYQRCLADQKEKMLANLSGASVKGINPKNLQDEEDSADEVRLQEEFVQLLQLMEDYLQPITQQLDVVLRPPSTSSGSNAEAPVKGKPPKEELPSQECVVLLADPHLMELPLEALSCLQGETIVSLTRDVSLQMLYHRFCVEPLDEAAEKVKKEKEKTNPPPRLPGLRDAAKRQAKIIPLERSVPAGFQAVDTHSFRFICDPHSDCSDTEKFKPTEMLNEILEEHVQQFTPRWLGVSGEDHVPSSGEYETYLVEGQAFIFYGMERFLCYLPPHKVASLELPECQFVMMLDLAQTSQSSLRQSKMDVLKTHDVLALERPVESAALLSLAGVKCIMQNQWHCTLQENAHRLRMSMRDMLEKGLSSGQTVRMLFTPHRRQKASDREEAPKDEPAKDDARSEKELVNEEDEVKDKMRRACFNMVCYGLPNLMVAQLTKP